MDRVAELTEIVRREVEDYANANPYQFTGYYVEDPARHIYTVLIVGDRVVIDEDTTDRPLDQALLKAGIPAEKIVRLFAGETLE